VRRRLDGAWKSCPRTDSRSNCNKREDSYDLARTVRRLHQYALCCAFNMSVSYAGVEDLQVFANNTGYAANFALSECAYCWVKGVESNYTDGDHVEVYWGFRDEIRDSYFSNAFFTAPEFMIRISRLPSRPAPV